jgi:glycerol-3-phosphate acyltransferase PlsY
MPLPPVEECLLILIGISYLIGSIPFGLLAGLTRGIDIRKAGSGNIGASNIGRLLGKRYYVAVLLLDMGKGMLPVLAATVIARSTPPTVRLYLLWVAVGIAAIAGHMFSIFLKFRGGKGVATSGGVMLGLWPFFTFPGIIAIATYLAGRYGTRYVSIGSIAAALSFPISYLSIALICSWDPFGTQLPLLVCSLLVASSVIFKHRSNLARLRAGTENRAPARQQNRPVPASDGRLKT